MELTDLDITVKLKIEKEPFGVRFTVKDIKEVKELKSCLENASPLLWEAFDRVINKDKRELKLKKAKALLKTD